MERSRITRYVRIAVTALSLTACVLLIVLWVRSFWWEDRLSGRVIGSQVISLTSAKGTVTFGTYTWATDGMSWHIFSERIDQNFRRPLTRLGFAVIKPEIPRTIFLCVPYWFQLLFAATAAAAPWIPWRRRRFSLRTLLIATTLVAVGLGMVIYLVR